MVIMNLVAYVMFYAFIALGVFWITDSYLEDEKQSLSIAIIWPITLLILFFKIFFRTAFRGIKLALKL